MNKPDMKHYGNRYVKLTDGNNHEVLLEYVDEEQREYKGTIRWQMVFRVWKHKINGGAMISYDPPKIFETRAEEFGKLAIMAIDKGQPAFWVNVLYHEKSKDWIIKPSMQPNPVDAETVKEAVNSTSRRF